MDKTGIAALLKKTTGPSKSLDRAIARELNVPLKDYSSSVDACLKLIRQRLPVAHWHVGRAEDGVSVYATLRNGERSVESTNTTVPLALLSVLVAFLKEA
ncbi:MAG: hypothetical protein HQ513_05015 [Rhodospirillales bacterium]|nr:hypothetical protein [Rhodospirillales bacterium]